MVSNWESEGAKDYTYHQRGKMDMASMYKATDKLVTVGVVFRSTDNSGRAAATR